MANGGSVFTCWAGMDRPSFWWKRAILTWISLWSDMVPNLERADEDNEGKNKRRENNKNSREILSFLVRSFPSTSLPIRLTCLLCFVAAHTTSPSRHVFHLVLPHCIRHVVCTCSLITNSCFHFPHETCWHRSRPCIITNKQTKKKNLTVLYLTSICMCDLDCRFSPSG